MSLQKPKIFSQFPDLIFGFSTKQNHNIDDKFGFNLSKSIGDDEKKVIENRSKFFAEFDLGLENVVIQKQTHSSIINFVDKFVNNLEGDALITKTKNLGLAVSTADCTNIYIYDSKEKVIAAIHSGWEGTEKKILAKTIQKLKDDFNSNPQNLFVYFGPSISQQNYEVGKEFLNKFDKKYLTQNGEKYLLDLKAANKDMLINLGVPNSQIEISEICSFENPNFHSYRRDKRNSGRAFGVIAIKGSNE
ncbi:MAG: peptidoglycan editing factor PgeF [Ignavibacteriales bacterium]|nr:peptidoglycan editing factor PgeF [Ignavibacteriales bacterium]